MSYANGTTHYNLPQTVGTDKRDWFDTNAAFAAVDAALYAAATGQASDAEAITALQQTVAGQATDIAGLGTLTGQHTSQIAALNTTVNNLGTEVADVRQDAEDMITANNEGAAATSTRAYAIGDYFIYNDVLYKATSDIAIGDTIVPNTNCVATNVDTELTQVNDDLSNFVEISNLTFNTQIAGTNYMSRMARIGNLVIVQAQFALRAVSTADDIIYTLPTNGHFTPVSRREITCMSVNNITQMRVNTDGTLTLHASQQVDEYNLLGIYAVKG